MEVAGRPTNAKRNGRTHIFYDDDEPTDFVPSKPPSFAGQYKDTSKILSWLPAVAGAEVHNESHGGRKAFQSQYKAANFLTHHEYPRQPKPAPSRGRTGMKHGQSSRARALGGMSDPRTSGEDGHFVHQPRGLGRPARVSQRDAAMMLPPIHGRPAVYGGKEQPTWGVKAERGAFK
jgi:hypothetical protein